MAIDMAAATQYELRQEVASAPEPQIRYTGLAIYDGQRWSAVVRELGIASDGSSAAEALTNLKAAVREAAQVAAERVLQSGRPMTDSEVLEFLQGHRPPEAVVGEQFLL